MKYKTTANDTKYSTKSNALRYMRGVFKGAEEVVNEKTDGVDFLLDGKIVGRVGREDVFEDMISEAQAVAGVDVVQEGEKAPAPTEKYSNISERLMRGLYGAFDHFNEVLFDKRIKDQPMFTIAAAGRRRALGWFGADRWNISGGATHEINLSAEYIGRSFEELMETVIHEMVHHINRQEKIEDCNAQQRHNKKFKVAAESAGLVVAKPTDRFAFGHTSLGDRAKAAIESLKEKVDMKAFEVARNGVVKKTGGGGTKSTAVVMDDGMKENLDSMLGIVPDSNNRQITRAALAFYLSFLRHSERVKDSATPANFSAAAYSFAQPAEEVEA